MAETTAMMGVDAVDTAAIMYGHVPQMQGCVMLLHDAAPMIASRAYFGKRTRREEVPSRDHYTEMVGWVPVPQTTRLSDGRRHLGSATYRNRRCGLLGASV